MSDAIDGYDVIVVGSGAAGGMAAHALTRKGVSVLMLEAGRDYDPTTETPMFQLPSDAPLHGASTPDKQYGYFDATVDGGFNIPGEPYSVAEGSEFQWWRARMLGGRTNHWGRLSLRFGPYDFQSYSRDGVGMDWPIGYEDIEPYYDRVEQLIGVFAGDQKLENEPAAPAHIRHDPPAFRAYEAWLKLVAEGKHDIPVVPAQMAILTREHNGRPACLYATDCMRGCSIGANFQSTTVLLPPALETGKLEIRTNAHVFKIEVDSAGRASGVTYIDKPTGELRRARARAVVMGASTLETARILLQSRSTAHPDGLGNSSGHVGRHLMDTPSVQVIAQVPQLEGLTPYNDEGVTLFHAYSPWWGYDAQRRGELDFRKGYHFEFWGGRRLPEFEDIAQLAELSDSVGGDLHDQMRRLYGSVVYITGSGEMVPNQQSYCELDTDVKDRFGLPVLKFHWRWGDEERKSCRHQRETAIGIFKSMNARIVNDVDIPIEQAMRPGGRRIHEAGTARMSPQASDGVLDRHGRAWDAPNVYVVDGAAFTSMPHKNPTLTILALAWRTADHLADALARHDV